MPEQWKPIPDWGNYAVSNMGRVKRIAPGRRTRVGKIIAPWVGKYHGVVLYKHGTHKTLSVARLVAEAFIANPSNLPEVNHQNGDKANNRSSNLEWSTRPDNVLHAFATGLKQSQKGSHHGRSYLTTKTIQEIRAAYAKGGVTHKTLAKQFGVSASHICGIVRRTFWKHI